jgi:hypothetical protein
MCQLSKSPPTCYRAEIKMEIKISTDLGGHEWLSIGTARENTADTAPVLDGRNQLM